MSVAGYEEIARTKMVVALWRADVLATAKSFGASSSAVAAAEDIRGLLERLVETCAALDKLADDAKEIAAKARVYLAETMTEVGAFSIKADGVQAVLADPVRYPRIVDKDKVPAAYWTTPEPKIDMTKLGVDMRKGAQVEGAELSNGGAYVLKISKSANKPHEVAA